VGGVNLQAHVRKEAFTRGVVGAILAIIFFILSQITYLR
jgi:hypothetical protein